MPAPNPSPSTGPSALPLSQWRTIELDLFRIYDGEVRHGGRGRAAPLARDVRNVVSSSSVAWLLRQGSGAYRVGNSKQQPIRSGYWVFPPRNITWRDFSEDARMLSIHFRASWPDGTFLFDVGSGVHVEASRYPGLETSAFKIKDIVHRSLKDFDWFLYDQALELEDYLQLDEFLHGWLVNVARTFADFAIFPTRTASLDERVEQGLRWLNSLPLNAKFLERQLASHLGLSVGHLNRLFSRELGRSAVDILEQRRLERAFHLLHYSCAPVKQVAYDLGFCSPSHFTAWFRAKTGKTPMQFRHFPGQA